MRMFPSTGFAAAGMNASAFAPTRRLSGLSKSHISPSQRVGTFTAFRGASFLSVRLESEGAFQSKPPKRGDISGFTDGSRRRMLDLMAKVQVKEVPVFVTLTYPDSFPLYSHEYKRHLEMFCARLQRRWPGASVIWKLEFKERKSGNNKGKVAPHYHLFVYGVPWEFPYQLEHRPGYCVTFNLFGQRLPFPVLAILEAAGPGQLLGGLSVPGHDRDRVERGQSCECLDNFQLWVSRNWYDVVKSEEIRHFRAGTRVERLRTVKGAFAYAAKRYLGKQDGLPQLEHKPGRFWGVIGRKNLRLGVRVHGEITVRQAVQLRRMIRRYRWANTRTEKRALLRKGGLWSREFSVKLYCHVDFWLERLPRLLEPFLELTNLPLPP